MSKTNTPKFRIEQLALGFPSDDYLLKEKAIAFLDRCGISDWVRDSVEATGTVRGRCGSNEASLMFNYSALVGPELELLKYEAGRNWLSGELPDGGPIVSHIGMHCDEAELVWWRKLMAEFEIELAQEVWTDSHTNARIAGCRRYHYVIFGTRHLIGVDMKFIVRTIIDPEEEARQVALDAERKANAADAKVGQLDVLAFEKLINPTKG